MSAMLPVLWTILSNEYVIGAAVTLAGYLYGKVRGRVKAVRELEDEASWIYGIAMEHLPMLEALAKKTETKVDDQVIALLKRLNERIGAEKMDALTPDQVEKLKALHESL